MSDISTKREKFNGLFRMALESLQIITKKSELLLLFYFMNYEKSVTLGEITFITIYPIRHY